MAAHARNPTAITDREKRHARQHNTTQSGILIRTEGSCPHLVSHLETEALTPVALVDPTPFPLTAYHSKRGLKFKPSNALQCNVCRPVIRRTSLILTRSLYSIPGSQDFFLFSVSVSVSVPLSAPLLIDDLPVSKEVLISYSIKAQRPRA